MNSKVLKNIVVSIITLIIISSTLFVPYSYATSEKAADDAYVTTYVEKDTPEIRKKNNFFLKSLKVDGYEVLPEFNPNTHVYYVTVPDKTSTIEIKAEPEEEKAKVTGTGIRKLTNSKEQKLDIFVKAIIGRVKKYTLVVSKVKENDLKLNSLSIDGVTLNKDFDKSIYTYTGKMLLNKENKDKPFVVHAKANDEKATVEIIKDDKVKEGSNLITIILKTKKDETVYQVIVDASKEEKIDLGEANKDNIILQTLFSTKKKMYVTIAIAVIVILLILIILVRK